MRGKARRGNQSVSHSICGSTGLNHHGRGILASLTKYVRNSQLQKKKKKSQAYQKAAAIICGNNDAKRENTRGWRKYHESSLFFPPLADRSRSNKKGYSWAVDFPVFIYMGNRQIIFGVHYYYFNMASVICFGRTL